MIVLKLLSVLGALSLGPPAHERGPSPRPRAAAGATAREGEGLGEVVRSDEGAAALDPALARREALAGALERLEGQLSWVGASDADRTDGFRIRTAHVDLRGGAVRNNDFALWMHGLGPQPGEQAQLNCWEALMLAAHRAGLVSKQGLQRVHVLAAVHGRMSPRRYHDPLASFLGIEQARELRDGPPPERGEVVFFAKYIGGYGWDPMWHVALALGTKDAEGRREILSLSKTQLPDGTESRHLERTTIEAVTGRYNYRVFASSMPALLGPGLPTLPRHRL